METSGRTWPNFELIQAYMHVLIAFKYEKDQVKNSGETVMMSFSRDFFQTLKGRQLRSPWSDLAKFYIQALMYIIITCKYEMNPIKNVRENVMTLFFPF